MDTNEMRRLENELVEAANLITDPTFTGVSPKMANHALKEFAEKFLLVYSFTNSSKDDSLYT